MILSHSVKYINKSVRSVNHIHFPFGFKTTACFPYNIIKTTQKLMPCNCLGTVRINNTVIFIHIWRIARHNIKRSFPKYSGSFLNITLNNTDSVLKMIKLHISSGKLCASLLNLKSTICATWILRLHKHRNNTITGTHIQHPVLLPCPGISRQQHCVHSKTKNMCILYKL